VIGRTFGHDLLGKVVPDYQAGLMRLVESDPFVIEGQPPSAAYTFSNVLIQETAYGSLLRSRRTEIHGLIAEALEQNRSDLVAAQPETLAHHFTEAGQFGRGIEYWLAAGRASLQRPATDEASSHLRRGLELLSERPERAEYRKPEIALWIALASMLRPALGPGHEEVERAYSNAYDLCDDEADTDELFPALYGLLHARRARGEIRLALADGEELLRLAAGDHGRLVVAHVWNMAAKPATPLMPQRTRHRLSFMVAIST
jgi:predicted ATPase